MKTKEVKKIESANTVINAEEMAAFVQEHLDAVPTVMKSRFVKLEPEKQYERMLHYVELQKLKEESASLTKIAYKVKQLFDQKKANREDAISVMEFCKRFIEICKERELAEVNEEIARLTELKSKLEKED